MLQVDFRMHHGKPALRWEMHQLMWKPEVPWALPPPLFKAMPIDASVDFHVACPFVPQGDASA